MEQAVLYVYLGGIGVAVLGYLWLLIEAFRKRVYWGLAVLFFPPAALIFLFAHWRRALGPVAVVILGVTATVVAAGISASGYAIDLGPLERVVDGEQHITLTGWDRNDYSVLKARPNVVVLQMANADVTDETLEYLRGMSQLRELDLNNTQVTDAGLAILKELPSLQSLKLKDTKITEQGFRDNLAEKESLQQLDLRGTQVGRDTVRAWRSAKPGRRALP
jgi:hypothetical protein